MTKAKKVVVTLAVGSFVALALVVSMVGSAHTTPSAQHEASVDANAVRLVQVLLFEDQLIAIQGGEAVTPKEIALNNFEIAQTVDARKLSQDYEANEVAADQKYKGSRILVSGAVRRISKNFMGDPYVTLTGNDLLQDVEAGFADKSENTLATLKKGQSVNFVCEVSERVVTEVMLKNCMTLGDYAEVMRPNSDKYVVDVLAGRKQVSKNAAKLIAHLYVIAKLLPQDSGCFQKADDACQMQIKEIVNKSGAEALNKEAGSFVARLNVK